MLNISVKDTLAYLKHYKYHDLVSILQQMYNECPKINDNLAHESRKNRHKRTMWREQIALNLPILYLASIYLHNFVKENKIKNLLFATRDCAHWYKIYSALYPHEKVHYFHCSRNMFNTARTKSRPDYIQYIDKITDNDLKHSVFIDIHGTGQRMYDFFYQRYNKIPSCFILSSGHSSPNTLSDEIQDLIYKERCEFLVFGASGSPIEMLNFDVIGTCNDYKNKGPVRAPLEYDEKYVSTYHECVNRFIEIIKQNPLGDRYKHGLKCLKKTITYLFEPALDESPIISRWIVHERKHIAN